MALVKPGGNTAPLLDCHRDDCGWSMCISGRKVEVVDIISLVRMWCGGARADAASGVALSELSNCSFTFFLPFTILYEISR